MKRSIFEQPLGWSARQRPEGRGSDDSIDLRRLWGAVRRQWLVAGLGVLLGLIVAVALHLSVPIRYTAVETILLDDQRAEILGQVSELPHVLWNDSRAQTEIEIIGSQELALAVVDQLGLERDLDFMNPPIGLLDRVRSTVRPLFDSLRREPAASGRSETSEASSAVPTPRTIAAYILRENLTVTRVERSFVFHLAYTDTNPVRAAEIARAYSDAYSHFRLHGATDVARSASDWLASRLESLREQSAEADRAVQEFRDEHGLQMVSGNLLADSQVSELASQLIYASAATTEARARVESFEDLVARGSGDAAAVFLTDTPSDGVLASLRDEYLRTRRELREIMAVRGENDRQAGSLQRALNDIEEAMEVELRRAAQGMRAALRIAQSREETLRESFEAATTESGAGNYLVGRLRQLQAVAETYSNVYIDYLQRFEAALQQQDFSLAAVQIISRAETPTEPSGPRRLALLALGLIAGGVAGTGVAAFRELRESPLRTRADVLEGIGVNCAGLMPERTQYRPGGLADRRDRLLERSLTSLKIAVDRQQTAKQGTVVGVASVTPGNEAVEVVSELFRMLSFNGQHVAILDARVAYRARDGLAGAVPPVKAAPGLEEGSEIMTLPGRSLVAAYGQPVLPADLASIGARLRHDRMYGIVVLPALAENACAELLSQSLDVTLLAIKWGKERPRLVCEALEENPGFAARLATTILVGANLRIARRYLRKGDFEEAILRGA